jgi:hypothetical protein
MAQQQRGKGRHPRSPTSRPVSAGSKSSRWLVLDAVNIFLLAKADLTWRAGVVISEEDPYRKSGASSKRR